MLKISWGKPAGKQLPKMQLRLGQLFLLFLAVSIMLLDTASFNAPGQVFLPGTHSVSSEGALPTDVSMRPWQEKDYAAINRRFDAQDTSFPKDLIKAIAWCESGWSQVDENGRLFITVNRQHQAGKSHRARISLDYGIMQINERMESLDRKIWDWELIKNDPEYNLKAGIAVLQSKVEYIRNLKRRPNWKQLEARYHLKGHDDLDLILKAYNGFQPSWAYTNRIRAALRDKPWEKAVLRQLFLEANRPQAVFLALAQPAENEAFDPAAVPGAGRGTEAEGIYYTLVLSQR